jgi:hypothetical protein
MTAIYFILEWAEYENQIYKIVKFKEMKVMPEIEEIYGVLYDNRGLFQTFAGACYGP